MRHRIACYHSQFSISRSKESFTAKTSSFLSCISLKDLSHPSLAFLLTGFITNLLFCTSSSASLSKLHWSKIDLGILIPLELPIDTIFTFMQVPPEGYEINK